ncbi:hypothetical protein CDEF62S_04483 [Castellaniella defragrans]
MKTSKEGLQAQEALRNFYARQAHLIDMGNHAQWAETFTPEGEFHSPTYGAPAVGRDSLAEISKRYQESARQAGEKQRHLVQNLWIEHCDSLSASTRSYLLIVAMKDGEANARILRAVTLIDTLQNRRGTWQVARREVVY